MWQGWVNCILGVWMIVAPFVLKTASVAQWNSVVAGILIAALSFWGNMGAASGAKSASKSA